MTPQVYNPVDFGQGEGHVILLPQNYSSIIQGTWTFHGTNSMIHGYGQNTSNADADELAFYAYLAGGTYTIELYAATNSDQGILDVEIDGVAVANFDTYSAGLTWNVRQVDLANVVVAGLYPIHACINGKNGASSGHKIILSSLAFWRTA